MPDEMSTTLELPTGSHAVAAAISRWDRLKYELQHPENHKQLIRFLVVGGSSYVVNLVTFWIVIHAGVPDLASLVIGFLLSNANNFFWSRHWTFSAKEEHPASQGVRFFAVSVFIFLVSTGIYWLLSHPGGIQQKTLADGIAWAVATPLSFLCQKLWTFKV